MAANQQEHGKRRAAEGDVPGAKRRREASALAEHGFEELEHVVVATCKPGQPCPQLEVLRYSDGDEEEEEEEDDGDEEGQDGCDAGKDERPWEERADAALASFCHPLPVEAFMRHVHQRKAMVVHGPEDRFDGVAEAHLCGLNLVGLVEETASENVFVWMRSTTEKGSLNSWEVDDPSAALKCFDSGASLYFRSPEPMAQAYVRAMNHALGINFAGLYADGGVRGEIEVFVSRPGHVTPAHFDYMDNFTLQLRGRKTWRLKRSTVPHPQRGCTPHYKGIDTFEQQLKVHRQEDPAFCLQPDDPFFDDADEVTLGPGSVLYHPPGIWHSVAVDGDDDSVSVNISLMPSSWADLASDRLHQLLTRRLAWREAVCLRTPSDSSGEAAAAAKAPVVGLAAARAESWQRDFVAARRRAAALLERLKSDVAALTVDDLVPPALVLPRLPEGGAAEAAGRLEASTRLRVCPVAVLFRAKDAVGSRGDDDDEEEDSDCGDAGGDNEAAQQVEFVVHHGFGNEELVTAVRRVIRAAPGAEAEAMDRVAARPAGDVFALGDEPGLGAALAACLVDAGFLTMPGQ